MAENHTIYLRLVDAEDPEVRAACELGWLNAVETGCMRACPGVRECTRYAIGRCLMRQLVADVRDCDPAEVALDEPLPGRAARVPPDARVVWSQDERWLAMALTADRPIALEVAPVRPAGSWRRLRHAIATPEESCWLDALPRRERPAALSRLRALKVAWLRAVGGASERDLAAISVIDAQGRCARRISGPSGDWFLAEAPTYNADVRLALAARTASVGEGEEPVIERWDASGIANPRDRRANSLCRTE